MTHEEIKYIAAAADALFAIARLLGDGVFFFERIKSQARIQSTRWQPSIDC